MEEWERLMQEYVRQNQPAPKKPRTKAERDEEVLAQPIPATPPKRPLQGKRRQHIQSMLEGMYRDYAGSADKAIIGEFNRPTDINRDVNWNAQATPEKHARYIMEGFKPGPMDAAQERAFGPAQFDEDILERIQQKSGRQFEEPRKRLYQPDQPAIKNHPIYQALLQELSQEGADRWEQSERNRSLEEAAKAGNVDPGVNAGSYAPPKNGGGSKTMGPDYDRSAMYQAEQAAAGKADLAENPEQEAPEKFVGPTAADMEIGAERQKRAEADEERFRLEDEGARASAESDAEQKAASLAQLRLDDEAQAQAAEAEDVAQMRKQQMDEDSLINKLKAEIDKPEGGVNLAQLLGIFALALNPKAGPQDAINFAQLTRQPYKDNRREKMEELKGVYEGRKARQQGEREMAGKQFDAQLRMALENAKMGGQFQLEGMRQTGADRRHAGTLSSQDADRQIRQQNLQRMLERDKGDLALGSRAEDRRDMEMLQSMEEFRLKQALAERAQNDRLAGRKADLMVEAMLRGTTMFDQVDPKARIALYKAALAKYGQQDGKDMNNLDQIFGGK
jgi:hypothetical protein